MGKFLLIDVLNKLDQFEPDDILYVDAQFDIAPEAGSGGDGGRPALWEVWL